MNQIIYVLTFIMLVSLWGCEDEPIPIEDQMALVPQPILLYDISLHVYQKHDNIITLRGGDGKYYKFSGKSEGPVATIIKRYGIGQYIKDFNPIAVDSVAVEDNAFLTKDLPEEVKVSDMSDTWNTMSTREKYKLLLFQLNLSDDLAESYSTRSWNDLPPEVSELIKK